MSGCADGPVEALIQRNLLPKGISDARIVEAFRAAPREAFVRPEDAARAYDNEALPIGYGQTISQPLMIALMLEALCVRPEHRVLEIGTGSGYQAALLAGMVSRVVTVERVPELARESAARLAALGYGNVRVIQGDGSLGYLPEAPYNRIVVSCAAPAPPSGLVGQLAEGGVLVVPVGSRDEQVLTVITVSHGEIREEKRGACVFVPLVGEQGWPNAGEECC